MRSSKELKQEIPGRINEGHGKAVLHLGCSCSARPKVGKHGVEKVVYLP